MDKSSKNKLKFLKGFILFCVFVVTLILAFAFYTAKKLPFESRILLKTLNSTEIMKDMTINKEKYEKLPCFEVKFGKSKYCFERSRAYIENKHLSRTTGEDYALSFYYLPDALLPLKRDDKFVSVMLYMNEDGEGRTYPDSRVYHSIVTQGSDKNKGKKIYENLINNSIDGKIIEVTDEMNFIGHSSVRKSRYFIGLKERNIVFLVELESTGGSYNFTGRVFYQLPDNEEYYIRFYLVSNQKELKDFLNTALNIAVEINEYLEKSKIN